MMTYPIICTCSDNDGTLDIDDIIELVIRDESTGIDTFHFSFLFFVLIFISVTTALSEKRKGVI